MSTLPEQFSAASKSQIQAQLDFFESFGARAFDGAARLVALNIETGRAAVDNSSAALKELAAVRDPRDLLALTRTGPDFSAVMAYGSQWLSIVADVQAGLLRAAAPGARDAAPAPAPAPTAEAAPQASEDHVRALKPGHEPVVALQTETAPEPVAEEKPIARAASKVAGKPASAKPVAATVAAEGETLLPQVKPVEASPPPTVFDQDLLTPKRGKKR